MALIVSQYSASSATHQYRFNRKRGTPMFTAIRWPLDRPTIPPVAEVLVGGAWVALLSAPTEHDLLSEDCLQQYVS